MQMEKSHSHVLANPIVLARRSTEVDLFRELEVLRDSPEWSSGIARKVLIRYPDFQITLRE